MRRDTRDVLPRVAGGLDCLRCSRLGLHAQAPPMSVREMKVLERDAASVYSEGFEAGLREAVRIIARDSRAVVPFALRKAVTAAQAGAIHCEWRASVGRPYEHQDSERVMAQIHIVLNSISAGAL